jgi:hypothetical protein
MRCCGITKKFTRCQNRVGRYPFCRHHRYWPLYVLFSLSTILGLYAGLWQDLFFPLRSWFRISNTSVRLSIEVQEDRSRIPSWLKHVPEITKQKPEWETEESQKPLPDSLIIKQSTKLIGYYEFLIEGKSKELNEYPGPDYLHQQAQPARVFAQVVDLDEDGKDEVFVIITSKKYLLHPTGINAAFIINNKGVIVASTPLPQSIPYLDIKEAGVYSAYKQHGIIIDDTSNTKFETAFINNASILETPQGKKLLFAWIIDSSCYGGEHVFQVDLYTYNQGQLQLIDHVPRFWYGEAEFECDKYSMKIFRTELEEVKSFFRNNNMGNMDEIMEDIKKSMMEQGYLL